MFEMKDGYITCKNHMGTPYITDETGVIIAKLCNGCDEIKSLDEYHVKKRGLGNKHTFCKVCKNKKSREHFSKNKDRINEQHKKYREENKDKELERVKKYREENPEKIKKYYNDNWDKLAEYRKQYYKDNIEDFRDYRKRYYQENKDEVKQRRKVYYKANREKIIALNNKWSKENPEKKRIIVNRRRTLKKSLPFTLTGEQEITLLQIQEGKCILSDASENLHIEHFIPLSWGVGGTSFENCYYMEGSLNISKFNNNPFEWIKTQPEAYQQRFNDILVPMLAERNGMTVEAFAEYVYQCEKQYKDQNIEVGI